MSRNPDPETRKKKTLELWGICCCISSLSNTQFRILTLFCSVPVPSHKHSLSPLSLLGLPAVVAVAASQAQNVFAPGYFPLQIPWRCAKAASQVALVLHVCFPLCHYHFPLWWYKQNCVFDTFIKSRSPHLSPCGNPVVISTFSTSSHRFAASVWTCFEFIHSQTKRKRNPQ